MSMSNGGRLGFKGALPFNFGILAGFAAVMLICTAFCSTLTELIPAVKTRCLLPALPICFIWHGQLIKQRRYYRRPLAQRLLFQTYFAVYQP